MGRILIKVPETRKPSEQLYGSLRCTILHGQSRLGSYESSVKSCAMYQVAERATMMIIVSSAIARSDSHSDYKYYIH
jgi:hypothetical protein